MQILPYERKRADEIVAMWRLSKKEALGEYNEPHDFEGFLSFLTEKLEETHKMYIAVSDEDKVIGFLAYKQGEIDQLYIAPEFQGKGLGTRLLNIAKEENPEGLELYTFQCNTNAKRFYEKHGFRAVRYGTKNEENMPDILYKWSLEDKL